MPRRSPFSGSESFLRLHIQFSNESDGKCGSPDAKPERLSTFAANSLAVTLRLLSQENQETVQPSPESGK